MTFRQLLAEQIIALVSEAQLSAIEWGGDVHVPHGDIEVAREVGCKTREAGLEVAAYGSYYQVGESEAAGLSFASVLETALALGGPVIRVWAGKKSPGDADEHYREMVAADTQRIAAMAEDAGVPGVPGVGIAYEFHANTLTETAASAMDLLKAANHENVTTLWQVPLSVWSEQRLESLKTVLPQLSNVHVYHMTAVDGGIERRPLVEGEVDWIRDLGVINNDERLRYALLEFVQDDDPDCFLRDAAVLREWIERVCEQV